MKKVDREDSDDIELNDVIKKAKKNPWIIVTILLAIGLVAMYLYPLNCNAIGQVISVEEANTKIVDYINTIAPSEVSHISTQDLGALYQVTILYEGDEIPLYVSKDGKFWTSMVNSLEPRPTPPSTSADGGQQPPAEPPKSDKPVVELFVMSHCPYGTMAEKGIIPAVELLGNKIDFKLRFVYYAMHPTYGEVEEQLNQYCIQKEEPSKLIPYLKCFLKDGDGETCLTTANINSAKLSACTAAADTEFEITKNLEDESLWLSGRFPLFNIDKELNAQYSVQGSPSLVINGEQISSGRSPAAYLSVICAAFNTAPEECSQTLSDQQYSPGFGYDVGSSGGADAAQCG
jgi:glutaredoxin